MSWITIAAAAAVATVPYNAADEAAARAWVAKAGHRFDGAALGPADLVPLVKRLTGARVIGIGEATHGTHQDEAFKAELIKALVRAGAVDVVAIECNRAAGYGFDRYVRFGEGDPAALIRSPNFFSIWRNDAFGGLLLWLRAWNQKAARPIRIVGIDNQSTGVDASVALAFLSRHDPSTSTRLRGAMQALLPSPDGKPVFLFDWIAKSDRATFDAMIKAATELEASLNAAPPAWRDDPDFDEARYAAKVARQGLFEFNHQYRGADTKFDEAEYYSRRDVFMASNLIERIGSNRAALWAHDDHVASAFLEADEKAGWRNLGWSIRAKLGTDYQTVGFTWSRATLNVVSLPDAARNPPVETRIYSEVPLRNDRPGELGHLFSALPGDAWWIDMRSRPHSPALNRWAQRPTWRGYAGWRVDPANWQRKNEGGARAPDLGFDVIVWFRNMSPARVWPGR